VLECCFRAGAAVIELIQVRDQLLAVQSSKYGHHFGSEFVGMAACDVTLDYIRTGPLETAERALARRLVLFLQVALELLDPFKVFVAICADKLLHTVEHAVVGDRDARMSLSSGRTGIERGGRKG
jgi:hypothetical protein